MPAASEHRESDSHVRLHSLDGLRATMMLLGLVLHSACNYMDLEINDAWRFRDSQTSPFFSLLVGFIHAWRMPIFMFIAGFFGALLMEKRGLSSFYSHRLTRLGLPLVLFLPLMLPLTISGFLFANLSQQLGADAAWKIIRESSVTDFYSPFITIHLWFLYYLVIYSVLAYLLTPLSQKLPESVRPTTLITRIIGIPGTSLVLSIPLGWALTNSVLPGMLVPGVELIPEKASFLTYAFLYLCGWALWSRRDLLEKVSHWPNIVFSLSMAALLFMLWGFLIQGLEEAPEGRIFLASWVSGLVMWQAIWGFIGLFVKLTSKEIPRIRYFVDASYWIYLIHLPFTIWIPGFLVNRDWGSFVKFGITLTLTTLIGLITYDLIVRSTVIGKLLNGQKYPRALLRAIQNQPLK